MGTGRFAVGLLLAAVAGGCAVGPNYHTPETPAPATWSGMERSGPTTRPSSSTTRPADVATWWRTLNDPLLDDLMARAVESNLDLRIATARVREARAQRAVSTAAFWPQINLSGLYDYRGPSENAGPKSESSRSGGILSRLGLPTISARPGTISVSSNAAQPTVNATPPVVTVIPQQTTLGGGRLPSATIQPGAVSIPGGSALPTLTVSPPGSQAISEISRQQNLFQAGFDASWELDIFGGIRRSVEAADADLAAAEESRRDVLVTLLSEVALNYVELRGSQRRLAIAYENIAAQQDTVDLTQTRFQAGFTNELDVAQARAQLATTQSQVPLLESAIRQAIYQLSVLLGQPPGALVAELEKEAPIPATPPDVPIGLPSDLLRRRPDVRAAERQLAAATAQIGVATADLFPRFSLTGSFGAQTRDARHLLDSKSLFWSVGPAISWPVWEGGRIRANIEVQNALQEQALGTYEKTVLTAFQDVESALIAYTTEKVRHESLAEAVASNQQSADLSNELYSRGLIAFLNVLDSQRALYVSQDQLVQSETVTVANLITLYKALGGGWQACESPEAGK